MPTIAMVRKAPPDDYVYNTLMPDLVGHDRAAWAFIVYLKLWHAAGGPGHRGTAPVYGCPKCKGSISGSKQRFLIHRLITYVKLGASRVIW